MRQLFPIDYRTIFIDYRKTSKVSPFEYGSFLLMNHDTGEEGKQSPVLSGDQKLEF